MPIEVVLQTNICVMYLVWQHKVAKDKEYSLGRRVFLIMEMGDNPVSVQIGVGGEVHETKCEELSANSPGLMNMHSCQ